VPEAKIDGWSVELPDPTATEPALLWNGIIGVRVGRFGSMPADSKTWFDASRYEGGEEKLAPLENPLDLRVEVNGSPVETQVLDYVQRLEFRTGRLLTKWKTRDATIEVDTRLPKGSKLVNQIWRITTPKEATAVVTCGKANGQPKVEGYAGGSWLHAGRDLKWDGRIDEGQTLMISRHVSPTAESSEDPKPPEEAVGTDIATDGPV